MVNTLRLSLLTLQPKFDSPSCTLTSVREKVLLTWSMIAVQDHPLLHLLTSAARYRLKMNAVPVRLTSEYKLL